MEIKREKPQVLFIDIIYPNTFHQRFNKFSSRNSCFGVFQNKRVIHWSESKVNKEVLDIKRKLTDGIPFYNYCWGGGKK